MSSPRWTIRDSSVRLVPARTASRLRMSPERSPSRCWVAALLRTRTCYVLLEDVRKYLYIGTSVDEAERTATRVLPSPEAHLRTSQGHVCRPVWGTIADFLEGNVRL